MLSDYTGMTLPWGTLTGIRPTKIPMALLEQGMSNREIADHMRKTYLISPEKTSLGISIANRERHILRDIDYDNGYSLYVGSRSAPVSVSTVPSVPVLFLSGKRRSMIIWMHSVKRSLMERRFTETGSWIPYILAAERLRLWKRSSWTGCLRRSGSILISARFRNLR